MMQGIEIHTLICNRDILLAINNFKSLLCHDEFADMPVFLHDDGSLSKSDAELLLASIPNATIIDRKWADVEIAKFLTNHPLCRTFRLTHSPIHLWHKIKSFDYFLFSKTKRILGMDTDLLFMRKPRAVLDYIKTNTPFYFPDLQSAYCFNEPKNEIPVVERANTGLMFIPSPEYYSLDALEHALSNLIRNNVNYFPSWIEQSAFAHMFYVDGRYKVLPEGKYRIPYFQNVDIELVECLHFVSYPAVRETYKRYTDYLHFDGGTEFYKKDFVTAFDGKSVPLQVAMSRNDRMCICTFHWDLKTAGQHALDHFFRIEVDGEESIIHKFQSSPTGFFFVNGKFKSIRMFHTFDWYGRQDWKLLDTLIIP